MKNKTGIIILFTIQALGIPFALVAGFMLLFSIANFFQTDWSQTEVFVQAIIALITMLIGVSYIGTYFFSLIKTISNKGISFISCLPILHGIVAVIALILWFLIASLFK